VAIATTKWTTTWLRCWVTFNNARAIIRQQVGWGFARCHDSG
jgi:hypothetical protein